MYQQHQLLEKWNNNYIVCLLQKISIKVCMQCILADAKMVRSRKQVSRGGGGVKGAGTPRFRYDKKRGVYVYKKQGGSLFSSIKKGLTKIMPKVINATKPLGKAIVKKGLKAARNPRNRKRLMMLAASAGKGAVGRITGDPQLARLAENQIKNAAVKTERHLMKGRRVNKRFVKKLVDHM